MHPTLQQALSTVLSLAFFVSIPLTSVFADSRTEWVSQQESQSWERLLQNVAPAGTTPGTVVASPSREAPNYWFHWVRDAGLVLDQVVSRRIRSQSTAEAQKLDQILWDFTQLSRKQQKTPNRSGAADQRGIGEPKFEVSGAAFTGDWGRPQNDSPAVRSLTLIRWAEFILNQTASPELEARVRKELYDSKLPSDSVIKNDLEYLAAHAQEPCIDLWEETWGNHFYTRTLAESALNEGARLARRLGDPYAADWYEKKSSELRKTLAEHWDPTKKILVVTRDQGQLAPTLLMETPVREWKPSGLDSAVILAILHRRPNPADLSWSLLDPRVQATFQTLEKTFQALYPINAVTRGTTVLLTPEVQLAPAIGRYPEDRYDGVETGSQGHAWVLATAAFGEFLFRTALIELEQNAGKTDPERTRLLDRVQTLIDRGEGYVARLQLHSDASGNWSEQIHRKTGALRGARDLSWSHAAFLSLIESRTQALQTFGRAQAALRSPLPR